MDQFFFTIPFDLPGDFRSQHGQGDGNQRHEQKEDNEDVAALGAMTGRNEPPRSWRKLHGNLESVAIMLSLLWSLLFSLSTHGLRRRLHSGAASRLTLEELANYQITRLQISQSAYPWVSGILPVVVQHIFDFHRIGEMRRTL